jgi:hypothetical protein
LYRSDVWVISPQSGIKGTHHRSEAFETFNVVSQTPSDMDPAGLKTNYDKIVSRTILLEDFTRNPRHHPFDVP